MCAMTVENPVEKAWKSGGRVDRESTRGSHNVYPSPPGVDTESTRGGDRESTCSRETYRTKRESYVRETVREYDSPYRYPSPGVNCGKLDRHSLRQRHRARPNGNDNGFL